VLVTNPIVAAKITGRTKDGVPRKGMTYIGFDAGNNLGVRSFFSTQDEAAWSLVRKGTAPAFSPSNIRKYYPQVLKHSNALMKHVKATADERSIEKGMDIQEEVRL